MYDDLDDDGDLEHDAGDHTADDAYHDDDAHGHHDADDDAHDSHAHSFDHAGGHDGGGHADDALGFAAQPYGASPNVVGSPAHDMQVWHQQAAADTCAVVAQEFVLESLTGHSYTEQQ